MRKIIKKRKFIKRHIIYFVIPLSLIIAGVVFFQFTPIGYCMSIRFRGFTEVEHNIFINDTYSYVTVTENDEFISKDNIPALVTESKKRVEDFFGGELQCDPVIIISDDTGIVKRTGNKNEYTVALYKVFSYIIISHNYLNIDVLSHEITHTELHYRLINGKLLRFGPYLPLWFDEGLASINDYRDKMSEETWAKKTDNGTNIIDVTKLKQKEFQDSRATENAFIALQIQDYYLMSRHKVKSWLDKNGTDGLLRLIEGVRKGDDFYRIYTELE